MKKTAIIGQYGEGPDYVTGQAVKTHATVDWMIGRFGRENVEIVNSYGWKKRPLRLFLSMIRAMARCKNVIILPAQHGVKVFPPAVRSLNRLFHRRIFFIVIGGWLADTLKEKPALRRAVAAFDGVCAETETLARRLREVGVPRAWCLPNFRDYVEAEEKRVSLTPPVEVCTYSRVTESKGIKDAAVICEKANALLGQSVFRLSVYGKVAPEYEDAFQKLCEEKKQVMRYCGVKNAGESLAVLRDQFALLFPTYYEGECFAGTALDAFLSRTPIIANDWKFNGEVIRDGVNGFLYPFRDTDKAAEKLAGLYRDPALYRQIQAGCEASAREYDASRVLEKLVKEMA